MSHPDVVVIGAGIVGCATAYELAKRGVSVTLIDRGEVSNGTTGLGEGNALCSEWVRTVPPWSALQVASGRAIAFGSNCRWSA